MTTDTLGQNGQDHEGRRPPKTRKAEWKQTGIVRIGPKTRIHRLIDQVAAFSFRVAKINISN